VQAMAFENCRPHEAGNSIISAAEKIPASDGAFFVCFFEKSALTSRFFFYILVLTRHYILA
ncbi:MAG: hypothetical protein K2G28_03720, partial [Acetatifactor sp.]|nr:hypothetical protein [Acetatifactor sp.]